ncbi:GumC family protein [Pelagibacterium halotolerans]|uniref:GumC family protein n=1 Tax=Pelagibacterium halotolerans TaxID=531813 RepID=UPI00384F8E1A
MTGPAQGADQPDASIAMGAIVRAVIVRLPRILFVTLILCAVTFAILTFMPRLYEARTSLLIEPRTTPFTRVTNDTTTSAVVDAATVASQIQLITSRETILAAVDGSGLREASEFAGLSDSELVEKVRDNLVVAQERDSRLVTIAFRAEDPQVAADLANAIAEAHIARLVDQQIQDTTGATLWLQREIDELRETVLEAERRVAEFRVENDLFIGQNNTSIVDQQLSNIATQITTTAERRNAAQSRAQLIRRMLENGQSVIGISDVQNSSVVQRLIEQKATLQGQRAQQSATLLSNHPTIRALDAQIAEIDQQIAAEGRRVAEALEAQAEIEADLETSLRADLEDLKQSAGAATRDGVTLAELEREAAAQRELLNAFLLRYSEAAARTDADSALPDVRIVSTAAPSDTPASPRTTLILLAVGIGSIILQVGAVIFSELLSGRALVERTEPEPPEPASRMPEPATEEKKDDPQEEPVGQGAPRLAPVAVEVESLAARVLAGTVRRISIATLDHWRDSADFAERLTARIVENGQSVAEVDAASSQQGIEPGLTDLCAGDADFGDVVHTGHDERFAFVPWGQVARLARQPAKGETLVEALSDIYEAVVVVTGTVGMASALPIFAQAGGCCILLTRDAARAQMARHEIEALGFEPVHVVVVSESKSEVA